MADKKSQRELEIEMKRDKLRRAKEYGEQVRRAAPGTENQKLNRPDLSDSEYGGDGGGGNGSPLKQRLRSLNDRFKDRDGGGGRGGGGSRMIVESDIHYQSPNNGGRKYWEIDDDDINGNNNGGGRGYTHHNNDYYRSPPNRKKESPTAQDMADMAERSFEMRRNLDQESYQDNGGGGGSGRGGGRKVNIQQQNNRGEFSDNTNSPTGKMSRWVSNLIQTTDEEDNLAKVYETGFHMLMIEKGIIDDN